MKNREIMKMDKSVAVPYSIAFLILDVRQIF